MVHLKAPTAGKAMAGPNSKRRQLGPGKTLSDHQSRRAQGHAPVLTLGLRCGRATQNPLRLASSPAQSSALSLKLAHH